MKPAMIDTDILSMFFRNDPNVKARFRDYLQEHGRMSISIITYYEILSGLRHRDARKQLTSFLEFAGLNMVLPLTRESTTISAEIFAKLRREGRPIDDIDIIIAGIAMNHKLVLITHNENHFGRIEGLEIMDWSRE